MLALFKKIRGPLTIGGAAKKHDQLLRNIDAYLESIEKKGLSVASQEAQYFLGDPWVSNKNNFAKAYSSILWVHVAIRILASSCSKLPLRIYEMKGDEKVEVTEGLAYDVFHKPSLYVTPTELKLFFFSSILYGGDSYLLLDPDRREIHNLLPQHVSIDAPRIDFIRRYIFKMGPVAQEVSLPVENVIHAKTFNPNSYHYGLSPLCAGWQQAQSLNFDAQYWNNFWKHGGRSMGVWTTEKNITEEQAKRFHEKIKNLYKGIQNMFRDIVLGNNMKYQALGVSQSDAKLIEKYKLSRDDILALYHIPSSMAGVLDQANYSNMEVQERVFWELACLPLLSLTEEALSSNKLLSNDGRYFFEFDTSMVRALQFLDLKRAEFGDLLIKSRQWTPNEVREELWEKEPIEGGEVLGTPQANPFLLSFDNVSRGTPQQDVKQQKQITAGTNKVKQKLFDKISKDEKTREAKAFDDLLKRHDNEIAKIMLLRFEEQKENVLRRLRKILKERGDVTLSSENIDEVVAPIMEFQSLTGDKLKKAMEDIVLFFGKRARHQLVQAQRKQLERNAVFNFNDPAILDYLQNRPYHIASVTDEFTLDFFRTGLAFQLDEDGSIAAVSKYTQDFFGGMEKWRSNRVARTETTAAANFAILETWNQNSELVEQKEWVTANDEAVRSSHRGVAPVGPNDHFVLGSGVQTLGPGQSGHAAEDVNCRCTVIAVVKGPEE